MPGSLPLDLVVVAHRLPLERFETEGGDIAHRRSPGGVVSALQSALHSRRALWIGTAGRSTDQPEVDAVDAWVDAGCEYDEIVLDRHVSAQYYLGFCNSALWPLYHDAVVAPVFDETDFTAYCEVNAIFAARAAERAPSGSLVWIHDYQLQLVPGMLRLLRPDLRIGLFLHTPFPSPHLFEQLPWRRELLEGVLGSDLVGFQTETDVQHFLTATEQCLGLTAHRGRVEWGDSSARRDVAVGCYPVGIDAAVFATTAALPEVAERAARIRHELGDPSVLVLGIDRLDYTKGIDRRIQAFSELIANGTADHYGAAMLQIAIPSREALHDYRYFRDVIDQLVVQAEAACVGASRLHVDYPQQPLDLLDLVAMYVAADVMLVTPLADGMNLVAKEYVATRLRDDGALVLSEFAGSARQLREAWLVDAHDIAALKDAIGAALAADDEERRRRMSSLRTQVHTHDVERWARTFLEALAQPVPA